MLFNRIFRERAMQRRARPEPLDDRLQITAPHEWLIVAGLALSVLALIIFGVFVRVERTVSYEATALLPGDRHYLVAPVSGTVVDVLVKVTDTVAPGQPIAYVQPSETQYLESALVRFLSALEESGQLPEGSRLELLQELLAAGPSTEFVPAAVIMSQDGGEVVTLDLEAGQILVAGAFVGLVRTEAAGQPEVVAFVSPDDAVRLKAGMEAHVSVHSSGSGGARVFQGRVAHVSPSEARPPQWLQAQGLAIPQRPHQMRVSLEGDEPDVPVADGAVVSVRVVLGRESLAFLLASGGR